MLNRLAVLGLLDELHIQVQVSFTIIFGRADSGVFRLHLGSRPPALPPCAQPARLGDGISPRMLARHDRTLSKRAGKASGRKGGSGGRPRPLLNLMLTAATLATALVLTMVDMFGSTGPPPAGPGTDGMRPFLSDTGVINEILPHRPESAAQFVELRNVNADVVDLSGYRLLRCDAAGNTVPIVTFPDGIVLAPFGSVGQYLLIAPGTIDGVTPDVVATPDVLPDGGVVLRTPVVTGNRHVDGMGYGTRAVPCLEGDPAESPAKALSSQRDAFGTDTDCNACDLTALRPTPQNRFSP